MADWQPAAKNQNLDQTPTSNLKSPASGAGEVNLSIVIMVFLVIGMLALGGLAIYYIAQFNREKTTVDEQAAEAAAAARAEQKQADEADFAERAKQPYRSYTAPPIIGSLTINFPKTWNVYAEEGEGTGAELNVFMNPEAVRGEKTYDGAYALRVSLERTLYTEAVKKLQKAIEKGELTAAAVSVSGISGTRYSGKVAEEHTGILVMLPVRDKTLSIWTESNDYVADFNTIIARLSLVP
ncbi:hypothetical protein HY441_00915 [Candidatus Microgenomates bacterium]|nr:hypothetical protein [Candidatus Microgenomates bacterium]